MDSVIANIIEELKTQLSPIEAEETRLRNQLVELKTQKKKIKTALKALGDGPQRARSPKQSKPCATKNEVIQIMMELLKDNGSLAQNDLQDLTKSRLVEDRSKNLSGFSLRFKEALKKSDFVISEHGEVKLLATD